MRGYIKELNLPSNEILFLHIKLKGIADEISYGELSKNIIRILIELYKPKTILVPTFTYSFTERGVFNRMDSPSEVGRFSEEIRKLYSYKHRTINPIFSVVDINNYFQNFELKDESAFGEDSLLHLLHELGHIVVNINVDEFISTYLHYLEYTYKVPYRFVKKFPGEVIISDEVKKEVNFRYYVRDLEKDPTWDREKVKNTLLSEGGLNFFDFQKFQVMWSHSKEMEKILGPKLEADGNFLLA